MGKKGKHQTTPPKKCGERWIADCIKAWGWHCHLYPYKNNNKCGHLILNPRRKSKKIMFSEPWELLTDEE